jgi:hypothetical protein
MVMNKMTPVLENIAHSLIRINKLGLIVDKEVPNLATGGKYLTTHIIDHKIKLQTPSLLSTLQPIIQSVVVSLAQRRSAACK